MTVVTATEGETWRDPAVDPDARCAAIAASQFGLVDISQARRAGLSDRQIQGRVSRGSWHRFYPGVFALAGVPASFEQRALAAALYAGRGAAVAFEAAGYLWGLLETEPEIVDLWTPRGIGAPGLRIHRARTLVRGDITRLGPIPITDPARTIIDLASMLEEPTLEEVLHTGTSRGMPSRQRLERRLGAVGSQGRRGPRLISDLLSLCPGRTPESLWETRFFRDLRTLGKPYPVPQYPFSYRRERFRHDFFYLEERFGIECDSREGHLAPRDFERERRKLNALQHMPWKVLHVTYRWYGSDRDGVLDRVAEELGRRRSCQD